MPTFSDRFRGWPSRTNFLNDMAVLLAFLIALSTFMNEVKQREKMSQRLNAGAFDVIFSLVGALNYVRKFELICFELRLVENNRKGLITIIKRLAS